MDGRGLMMRRMREPHGEIRVRLWVLLPLRLYVGIQLVVASLVKVAQGVFSDPQQLVAGFVERMDSKEYSWVFFRSIYHAVVEPRLAYFAFLVVAAELFIGLLIVTGTLTRLASAAGLFLMFCFFLAFDKPVLGPDETTAFAVMLLVLMLSGAGRAYGVDYVLKEKLPPWVV